MKNESKPSFECKYCHHGFKKESTLARHQCEPKRRYQQQNDQGVQLGLRAYQRFYQLTQSSLKPKTYDEFVASAYYSAFVKFGQYCVSVRCINFSQFLEWLLKNNKRLDRWASDAMYSEWSLIWSRREAVEDALARSIEEMQRTADGQPDLKNGYVDYFRYLPANKICYDIVTARCSPWAVYCCASGVAFLEKLNQEQLAMIMPWIDPDHWQKKLLTHAEDAAWASTVLAEAGL